MEKIIFFLVLTVCVNPVWTSTYSYRHFSIEDGLPSSEVYSVIQDDYGYMWFGTDRGVVRYDGYEFEVFTTEDGLPDNVIFHLEKDHKGRIWFGSYSRLLSYHSNGKIYPYKYNGILSKNFTRSIIRSLQVDSVENVHVGLTEGRLTIHHDGKVTKNASSKSYYNIKRIGENLLHYSMDIRDSSYKSTNFVEVNGLCEDSIIHDLNRAHFNPLFNYFYVAPINGGDSFFLSISNKLFYFDQCSFQHVKSTTSNIIHLSTYNDELYIGMYEHGFETINIHTFQTMHKGLLGNSVSGVFLDSDHSTWVTTLENGIFYIPNVKHITINQTDGLLTDFIYKTIGAKNELLIEDRLGNLFFMDYETNQISRVKVNSPSPDPFEILYNISTNDFLTIENKRARQIIDSGKQYSYYTGNSHIIGFYNDSTILGYNRLINAFLLYPYEHRVKINPDTILLSKELPQKPENIESILVENNRILYTSIIGLFEIDSNFKIVPWHTKDSLFKVRAGEVLKYKNFDFIVGTRGEGILFVKNEVPYPLKEEHGLISNQITTLFVDSSNTIWVGSSKGLSIVNSVNGIQNLRVENGLISNEITDIHVTSHYAYIGTKKGLTILDRKSIYKAEPIPIRIKGIELEQTIFKEFRDTLELPYDSPFINIHFSGISYKSGGRIKYRYRLNEDENWQFTKSTNLLFSNLNPGNYRLEIYASDGENGWSTEPALLYINIAYPFWQTWPFRIIVLVMLLALLLFGYKIAIVRLKKREGLKRQIQSLRFEALSAQMNPHFMFNSLNAIQNFIMQNEKKASIRYLAKFARLMRMTLNHSQSKNTSLFDELQALRLYLELESLRFDNQFEYKIDVNAQIRQNDIIIPALLIQPIVENAILHGLRPLERGGIVQVIIVIENNRLILVIEDNGVGRSVKQKQKANGHKSKGNALTEERVALFAKDNDDSYIYKIDDLPKGTRVTMDIPIVIKPKRDEV